MHVSFVLYFIFLFLAGAWLGPSSPDKAETTDRENALCITALEPCLQHSNLQMISYFDGRQD